MSEITLPNGLKARQVASMDAKGEKEALVMYAVSDGSFVVADLTTKKSILCVSYTQGIEILQCCWGKYQAARA